MDKLFEALVDTNIPTLLTISGIALLFLALAGRFGAYIEIKEERQKFTLMAGVLLLIAGIALHVMPSFLSSDDERPLAGDSNTQPIAVDDPGEGNEYWIQVGAFRTPGSADDFRQTLFNRLNRVPSVPELKVQVLDGAVTGCEVDRVVVIPSDPNNADGVKSDFDRVRAIVNGALLRTREEVLNSQTECR